MTSHETHPAVLIQIVERLVRAFDERGIMWCVLRNYELFPSPKSSTSDLDFLVECSADTAFLILNEVIGITAIGIGRTYKKLDGTMQGVFLTVPGSAALHLDFFQSVAWAGSALCDTSLILQKSVKKSNCRIPSPGHEALSMLLTHLFHRGEVKANYRMAIRELARSHEADFIAGLASVWGGHLATKIARNAQAGDWEWFAQWVPRAKRNLLIKTMMSPVTFAKRFVQICRRITQRITDPPGLWVAFLGPDGAGKTTLAGAYRERLQGIFGLPDQRHFHWRPGLLPAPGSLVGQPQRNADYSVPHAKAMRGRVVSVLRLAYFWFDYVIGHWAYIKAVIAKGGLVTFDRYYDDFLIDPQRYRIALPRLLLRLVGRTIPKPELIFVLDATGAILHDRKRELSVTEIDGQLEILRQMARNAPNTILVQVDREIAAIVDDLERETLSYLNRRERHRLGWMKPKAGGHIGGIPR